MRRHELLQSIQDEVQTELVLIAVVVARLEDVLDGQSGQVRELLGGELLEEGCRGAGRLLFGLHLVHIGYLAYRSGYIPRVLGGLLSIAGLGYTIDSLGAVLSENPWTDISAFTFLGELLLAIWLVIRARRIATGAAVLEADSAPGRALDASSV